MKKPETELLPERVAPLEMQEASPEKSDEDLDLLPEYCHYEDEGCELSASCLNCPFPRCAYDKPWGRTKQANILRDREIRRLYLKNKSLDELVVYFKVSLRTVRRALAAGGKKRGK